MTDAAATLPPPPPPSEAPEESIGFDSPTPEDQAAADKSPQKVKPKARPKPGRAQLTPEEVNRWVELSLAASSKTDQWSLFLRKLQYKYKMTDNDGINPTTGEIDRRPTTEKAKEVCAKLPTEISDGERQELEELTYAKNINQAELTALTSGLKAKYSVPPFAQLDPKFRWTWPEK